MDAFDQMKDLDETLKAFEDKIRNGDVSPGDVDEFRKALHEGRDVRMKDIAENTKVEMLFNNGVNWSERGDFLLFELWLEHSKVVGPRIIAVVVVAYGVWADFIVGEFISAELSAE